MFDACVLLSLADLGLPGFLTGPKTSVVDAGPWVHAVVVTLPNSLKKIKFV